MKLHSRSTAEIAVSAPVGCNNPLMTLDEAMQAIDQNVAPLGEVEACALFKANGRVLAQNIIAKTSVPPFDAAAMDGYAVSTEAFQGLGPWSFQVVQTLPAGQCSNRPLDAMDVARIYTGAPVPQWADAVIAQEDAMREGNSVTFSEIPDRGLNVRKIGCDMARGQMVVPTGTRLRPTRIGACSAAGATELRVSSAVKVAVITTGDELIGPQRPHRPGMICDVNGPMLLSQLAQPSIEICQSLHCPDRAAAIRDAITSLPEDVNLLVTTGGISVGDRDHVKPMMNALGADMIINGVALKPGKPIMLGRLGKMWWLGLPGNPLAAFTCWHLFGQSVVNTLLGQQNHRVKPVRAKLMHSLSHKTDRTEFRPARLVQSGTTAELLADVDTCLNSGNVNCLAHSDALVHLPADQARFSAGSYVDAYPIH